MNRKKKGINRLQNLVLVLLTVSALFLLSRFPIFTESWSTRVHAFLAARPDTGVQDQLTDLSSVLSSVHLVVTSDSNYGRYSQLYASADDPLISQRITLLFREALGSATVVGMTADMTLQEALSTPSLYLDLTTHLPLDVVAAWLGETVGFQRDVRSMALTTEEEGTAMLYLRSEDGTIFRYRTALTASAVEDTARSFTPNGGSFAFESNYSPLSPYTVLVSEAPSLPGISSSLPDGYSAYNLLSALDFNPHTNFRYTESGSGVEVVEESPRTLRIGPDGSVSYSGEGEISSSLFRVSCAGESPTAVEALQAARRLASALSEGTDSSPLFLHTVEATESGWSVTFRYQVGGVPVHLPNDTSALSVTIAGQHVTAFTYFCRSYTEAGADADAGGGVEQQSALLPPSMAVAIASLRPGAGLSIGYVDSGSDPIFACWLDS